MEENNKKKSFLEDLASETKPESFQEEVFIKSKRNYVPVIVFSTLAIAIFAILFFYFTKGAEVPDMSDWKENEIYAWANKNNATIVKTDEYSLDVEAGYLISQDIEPGDKVRRNGTLKITISNGADPNESISFPDVKNMTLNDIQDWIDDNHLQGVSIKKENSTVFDKDTVINYEFTDGTESNFVRKSRVKIYVSLGPEELKDTITVPSFTDKTKSEVAKWASNNDILVEYLEDYNEYVDFGRIYDQSISGNTKMKRDDTLTITLSLGKPLIVPTFVGMDRDEAMDIAKLDNIELFYKNQVSSKKEGTVIAQDIEPGTTVSSKKLITLTIATASDLVVVPDFVGLDESQASALANLNNVKTFVITKKSTEKENTIVEQSVSAGYTISTEDMVTLYVSSGDLVIPDLVGLNREDTELLLDTMGLQAVYKEVDDISNKSGQIIGQSLAPDTVIEKDDRIIIEVAKNNGTLIPDFTGQTRTDVDLWGSLNNTSITVIEKYSDIVRAGELFDQNVTGTYIAGQQPLVIYLSLGKVVVDDFTGSTQIEVDAWLREVNEKGGEIKINTKYTYDTTKAYGTIVSQSVKKDYVFIGTSIDLVVAEKSINNSLPDFTGLTEQQATEWCEDNGIAYTVLLRYSKETPSGKICGQNITNEPIESVSAITLYKSKGGLYVPSYLNQSKATLVNWANTKNLEGAGITLNFSYEYVEDEDKETILRQSVHSRNVDPNFSIDVVLAAPKYVSIPVLNGLTEAEATAKLEALDVDYELYYLHVNEEVAKNYPAGTVLSQSVDGQIEFNDYETIIVRISEGKSY